MVRGVVTREGMSIRKSTWRSAKGERSAWVVDYKDQQGKRRLKTFMVREVGTRKGTRLAMSIRKRTWRSAKGERSAWVVVYENQQGKHRQKTFATKKAADAWATDALIQVKQGTHTSESASITAASAASTRRGSSTSSRGHFNLGRVLLSQGKIDEAKRSFERALSHNPEYVPAIKGIELIRQDWGEDL